MCVRVAQSVEDVTADYRLFHLEGVAGSSPTVYFYFFQYVLFCYVLLFFCVLFLFCLFIILFNVFHYFYFNSFHLIL